MIEYSLISSALGEFISWIASVLSKGVPGLVGAISAIGGTYFGFLLTSKRNRMETLREEVCRPMMNEFGSILDGEMPTESNWDEIDTLSKHLLDQNLVRQFGDYASKIERRADLDRKTSSFEEQVTSHVRTNSEAHAIHIREGEVNVVTGLVSHPDDPLETRLVTTSLSEFVEALPDVEDLFGETPASPFKFQENLDEWARSEDCPYEDLAMAWSKATRNPKYEFANIANDSLVGYQENVRAKSELDAEIEREATDLLDELKHVVGMEFSFRKQFASLVPLRRTK